MSTSLQPTRPAEDQDEVEHAGPTYRLSVDQYHRMKDEGILIRADGVELLEGVIYRKGAPADPPSAQFYRLRVDQYRAMCRLGILTKDDRVELLEGWLVAKMSKNRPHIVSVTRTWNAISSLLPADWFVAKEDPVLGLDGEPEPDISVVQGTILDYLEQTPGPLQVALVVEVAETSLNLDRNKKKRLYARSGFATYWLINLIDRRVEVYTEPAGPTEQPDYLQRRDYQPGDQVPVVLGGQEIGLIPVADLLP